MRKKINKLQPEIMEYPPIYNFPPFFTRQLNEDTWRKQLQLWSDLILEYFRYHRIYQLNVNEALLKAPFRNENISRQMKLPMLLEIIEHLIKQGNAEAAITGPNTKPSTSKQQNLSFLIMWRSPVDWAKYLYAWVEDGGMKGQVCTLFELVSSDDYADQEFHGLDPAVLLKALKILESEGKAQIFQGSSPDDRGVKFF